MKSTAGHTGPENKNKNVNVKSEALTWLNKRGRILCGAIERVLFVMLSLSLSLLLQCDSVLMVFCGRVDKSTKLKLLSFCLAECGLEFRS